MKMKSMPQNHRPGSTFGTPNKPQMLGAQPMPLNHGYGKSLFGGNANNKPNAMPQNHQPGSTFGSSNKPSSGGAPMPFNHRSGRGR
jgi:hypothetical protein